jgi:hypothetical protein
MKLSQTELVVVGLLIVYIAFFTHPPPSHIKDFLSSPVGHAVFLAAVLYVTAYKSLVVGVFLGIAYLTTATGVTEYLPEKPAEQTPPPTKPAPAGMADVMNMVKSSMEKGDTVAHKAVAGKSVTAPPPEKQVPVGSHSSTVTKTSSNITH